MNPARLLRLGQRLRALGLPVVSPSYEALAREASDEVLVTTAEGRITFCSPTFSRRWGVDRWALVGGDAFSWTHPEDRERVRAAFAAVCRPGSESVDSEHRYVVRSTGEVRWCRVRFSDARRVPGVGGIVWNCQDVTEVHDTLDALRHAATHDPLTGLGNRRRLLEVMERSLTDGLDSALLLLNLDGLKTVNDRHGHAVGDLVVRAVAERLDALVGDRGWLGRLDGDEFAVLLRGQEGPLSRALADLAQRAVGVARRPVEVEGRAVAVTAAAGTALLPGGDAGADAVEAGRRLFRHADIALGAAKAAGGNRWVPFSRALLDAAHDRAELAADLRHAVATGGLHLALQPLVDLAAGRTVGFEALVRWQHPQRGNVPPSVFVEVAEESGTILDLGAFVLESALEALVELQRAAGRSGLEVSVNLSGHQLQQPGLVAAVVDALRRHGLAPGQLCLEVTESVAVADLATARNTLQELRSHGVRIALDDFGTGYSSLSYLRRLPVDVLKIDKSFVDDVSGERADATGAAVLSGIVALSSALGLVTVAEGIETEQSHEVVRGAGCTWGQGYLFARPLSPAQAAAHLAAEAQNPRYRSTTA
ncbi:putative bifunctional diguanylate cyclase/phosphodiesterase [Kineococcus radiotolerans]|uniref:Diguanylate cyclase/phosphodiesterase with PAS/PAC sensor(S) n=1 Tax=Kineococcus radiotolerans (strain ATCC BAA-149 / DSM 14245 / SRS30216) TaxID=266940 RepID=A6W5K6_KINRD|nr:GGDEF domain-containing protein [Kineococcus radiotolerans]ABS02095.1 diguanylate cyclase/phosphodiesterase with PAS/PAC sensor(s) [Kineococcus radiotolerans SRS30216 = ATCC BAA-149]